MEAVNQQRSPDGGVFWPQGEFAFGSQSREATVTDVKFLNASTLVVAVRNSAKLYLCHRSHATSLRCLDMVQLKCPVDASYKHPDLIVLSPDKRRIYVTLYRREIAVVDLIAEEGANGYINARALGAHFMPQVPPGPLTDLYIERFVALATRPTKGHV